MPTISPPDKPWFQERLQRRDGLLREIEDDFHFLLPLNRRSYWKKVGEELGLYPVSSFSSMPIIIV